MKGELFIERMHYFRSYPSIEAAEIALDTVNACSEGLEEVQVLLFCMFCHSVHGNFIVISFISTVMYFLRMKPLDCTRTFLYSGNMGIHIDILCICILNHIWLCIWELPELYPNARTSTFRHIYVSTNASVYIHSCIFFIQSMLKGLFLVYRCILFCWRSIPGQHGCRKPSEVLRKCEQA